MGEIILNYPGGPSVIIRVLRRDKQECRSQGGVRRCFAAGFEDGGRGRESRAAVGLWKLETARQDFYPRASRIVR